MLYRLPLELELIILQLAAPPLVKPRLAERVDFFIKISLVHRSFTAWAQERLHDQFLYTYRPRKDEAILLKEAGTAETMTSANEGQSSGGQSGPTINGHGIFEVRAQIPEFEWALSPLLARCLQSLDTLWLMPPYADLDLSGIPPPRLLESDDDAFRMDWDQLDSLPLSQQTTLLLRNTVLDDRSIGSGRCAVLNLILDKCVPYTLSESLSGFPDLDVLIACESSVLDGQPGRDWLPSSARHIHVLQSDLVDLQKTIPPAVLFPALESLTFTWLQPDTTDESGSHAAEDADPLSNLRRFVEATVVAPLCTFKYLRSTKAPEDALADAMADLGLDS